MENKIYIAKYSRGEYDDYWENDVFATFDKDKAQLWVDKFNTKLKKWKDYMFSYRSEKDYHKDLPDLLILDRYWQIVETNEAFIEEIEIR